jgi:hypothetical protein
MPAQDLHANLLEILGEFNFTIGRENALVMDLLIHPFEQEFDVGPSRNCSRFLKI